MKKRSLFLTGVFMGAVLLPIVCFGQINLEQDYPSWSSDPKTSLQSTVKANSLGQTIQFFVTWAIIISVLLAGLSLIYGGVLYLVSAGKTNQTTQAKQRIRESFIGLLILAGSYLVLQFINPQVTILQIKKTEVSSGTVLFSQTAFENNNPSNGFLKVNGHPLTIKELSEQKKLVYLNGTFPDLTQNQSLGELVATSWDQSGSPDLANFKNFPVFALGFWGEKSSGIEVHFFLDKHLKGKSTVFTDQGQVVEERVVQSNQSQTIVDGSGLQVKVVLLDKAFGSSAIKVSGTPPNGSKEFTFDNINIKHPPLSVSFKGKGIGVNLFSYFGDPNLSPYGMRFLNENVSDLRLFDFDDKAKTIELVSKDPQKKEPDKDLLVALFDGDQFKNEGRLFFTTRTLPAGIIAKIFFNENFYNGRFDLFYKSLNLRTGFNGSFNGWQYSFFEKDILAFGKDKIKDENPMPQPNLDKIYEKFNNEIVVGNTLAHDPDNLVPEQTSIKAKDHYGEVQGVSSLRIFELTDDFKTCQSVQVCEGPFGQGHCLNFTDDKNTRAR
ncbi:hypothetical protein FJ208_01765, partial [Candidatus Gribaldobacteria bacterium]|nr:hypothetical protein [Candidatus Gribaldobacteria bacterium]